MVTTIMDTLRVSVKTHGCDEWKKTITAVSNLVTSQLPFKPFQLILKFETREEYVFFHDKVRSTITKQGSHNFHRAFYLAGRGEIASNVYGEI